MKKRTWTADVVETMRNIGGIGHHEQICEAAKQVRIGRGATWSPTAEATIRRELEQNSSDTESFKGKTDLFYSVDGLGKGIWGLRPQYMTGEILEILSHRPAPIPAEFHVGALYNRQKEIHALFGGSQRSGICPSGDHPYIFIFTGGKGESFGYTDHWDDDGIFHYTGEGQIGDMSFLRGNKAIRDHVQNGKDLLLFEGTGHGKPYRFMGQFVCCGFEYKQILDKRGQERQGIIFQLKLAEGEEDQNITLPQASLNELRKKAYAASSSAPEVKTSAGNRNYYERNCDIKAYVLKRAEGKCECCGKQAPFTRKGGSPYLEPHHIYKLSDKGMDHPRMVAAITPNCHKEIHYGIDGHLIDQRLIKIVADKEDKLGK